MAMHLHFYADSESVAVLEGERHKALLVGGDFGYGNFGDVLQHLGTVDRIRAFTSLAAASIFSLDAISRHVSVTELRKSYGVDALLFVSEAPIDAGQADRLGLRKVEDLRNVACVQLYGGGFLNEQWGDFVLGVTEYFLLRLPSVRYIASGQQVSPGYAGRVGDHIGRFQPTLFGVRDKDSLAALAAIGVQADFSFDDAVEPLLGLAKDYELSRADGVFIHLNSSDYTGNDGELEEVAAHMRLVADRMGDARKPVLFQAFQDAREEVVDTLETVKRLETGFPFADVETILLVTSILGGGTTSKARRLTGRFGYSCSYHVALWLQLSGIPCWLRGSSAYYDQKRRALGIEGTFNEFLKRLPAPDHGENLRARESWGNRLAGVLGGIDAKSGQVELTQDEGATATCSFHFKGEPRLAPRLQEAWAAACGFREDAERLAAQLAKAEEDRLAAEVLLNSITSDRDSLADRLGDAEARYIDADAGLNRTIGELHAVSTQLDARIIEQDSLYSRLLAVTDQLATVRVEIGRKDETILCMQRQLDESSDVAEAYKSRLLVTEQSEARLIERNGALSARLTSLGSEHRELAVKLREAEAGWWAASRGNEQLNAALAAASTEKECLQHELESMGTRLLACQEQLTTVGAEAHRFRGQVEWANKTLQELSVREREMSERLDAVERSRSWRWTRPMRALVRYLRSGRFDSAGSVGLFEMARIVGRKMPLPARWKSALGRGLQTLRRR